jgi:hypothetical protein
MAAGTQASASAATTNVEVVTGTTSKPPVFSGNHGDDWTIWEMKMTAHLMEKGLDKCLDPNFEIRLPAKENGPFNMAVEEEKKFKEAVNLLMEGIASCDVKYGVPISNGKKIVQLIRLGGKKHSTVITVMQMCKKSKGLTCTPKHIVEKMWKQWCIKGGKEKGEEEDKEETTLAKVYDKTKEKAKGSRKAKDGKSKKKETRTCNHCGVKGHIKEKCWKKDPFTNP